MPPMVICCGLNCVDMELHACDTPSTREAITQFSNVTFTAGGSAPQTARALAALSIPTATLTVVGDDPQGRTMRDLLVKGGVDVTTLIVDAASCTSLAVLPLFTDGTRGCFVTLGANLTASVDALLPRSVVETSLTSALRVFHFGYPHLMPRLQGQNLRNLFDRVRQAAPNAILTMDVNGANAQESIQKHVLLPALEVTAAIHANLEEACTITGLAAPVQASTLSAKEIRPIVEWFTGRGAGIACITCGKDGAFIATKDLPDGTAWTERYQLSDQLECGAFIHRPACKVSEGVAVNASGAGDAFMAGVISELVASAGKEGVTRIADAGIVSALHRIDPSFKPDTKCNISALLDLATSRPRITCRPSLHPEVCDAGS